MIKKLPRVLVVDDDTVWLEQVPFILEGIAEVDCFSKVDQGLQALEKSFYDILLLDLNFDDENRSGMEIFHEVYALDRETDVIIVSGETDHQKLINIFNAGVSRYIAKPSTPDQIRQMVKEVLQQRELKSRALSLPGDLLIGSSSFIQKLRKQIERIVENGTKDILILGETGTGKEVVAKSICYRADPSKRFIPVHCGALSDGVVESELFGHVKGAFTGADRDKVGVFEAAGGGFIFLDEIGEMPLSHQAKLLRVLQERKVQRVGSFDERKANFRCISATNVDLKRAVEEKKFREDLFYRIAKEKIYLVPLRERLEDLPELAFFFLKQITGNRAKDISNKAMQVLQSYHWPGNIRQLRSVIETLANSSHELVIREKDVYQALPDVKKIMNLDALGGSYGKALLASERQRFEKALITAQGNRTKAAKLLGLSRATYFRRAKDLGLVKKAVKNVNQIDQKWM